MDLRNLSDEHLMEKAQASDEEAFYVLVNRYEKSLFNFICRMLERSDFQDPYPWAEDLYQETFLNVYRRLDSYDPTRKFSTWLYTIATRLCLNALKKEKRSIRFLWDNWIKREEENVPDGRISNILESPLEQLKSKELSAKITHALDALSEKHRLVFILKHYEGLRYEEIAQVLNCPVGTVKSCMHYALQRLRSIIT